MIAPLGDRHLMRISSDDEADWRLLGLANGKGKFAIHLGLVLDLDDQVAFERGIDREWFRLVDVSPVAAVSGRSLLRVFRLTQAGRARRAELAALFPDESGQ